MDQDLSDYGDATVFVPGDLPGDVCDEISPTQLLEVMDRAARATGRYKLKSGIEILHRLIPPPMPILVNTFNLGNKVMIVGSSKARKTFFTMQMAMSIAAGRTFLNWETRQRRVLLINLEGTEDEGDRRIQNMGKSMGMTDEEMSRIHVLHEYGRTFNIMDPEFMDILIEGKIEVIIIDPLYKILIDADENNGAECKPYLERFAEITATTGATIVYVHHCAKGVPGERSAIDRFAGSGYWARDADAMILINQHVEEDLMAVTPIVRNYEPQEPFSIRFEDTRFHLDDAPAELKTASSRADTEGPQLPSALSVFQSINSPMKMGKGVELLQTAGFSRRRGKRAIEDLIAMKLLRIETTSPPYSKWIGIPGAMMGIKDKLIKVDNCWTLTE